MASDLMLPDGLAPSNLHLRSSVKMRFVDGDVLDICERLAEISPRLYLVELSEDGVDKAVWCVMESCDDGVQRRVIKADELDSRLLQQVQYLMHVPFEHRLAAIEAENAKYEDDHHQNILDETYERMGHQFRYQLEHDGFITHRGVSYPKIGVAAPGRVR